MNLKSRLKKVETKIDNKNKESSPTLVVLYKDDNEEEVLNQLRVKYGEDYMPQMVIIRPKTRKKKK